MTENVKATNALAIFGADVQELAIRIENLLPATKELPPQGRLALAQVAVSMGLNPFMGEIWAIPKKADGRVIGWDIMAGIKGLRRGARTGNQGHYSITFRNMNSDEAAEWALQKGDVGKVCQLYRVTPADREIAKAIGEWPLILGYGVCRADERTKMAHPIVARKRAEADALKIGFDMPLVFSETDEGEAEPPDTGTLEDLFEPERKPVDVVDGEVVQEDQPQPTMRPVVRSIPPSDRPCGSSTAVWRPCAALT